MASSEARAHQLVSGRALTAPWSAVRLTRMLLCSSRKPSVNCGKVFYNNACWKTSISTTALRHCYLAILHYKKPEPGRTNERKEVKVSFGREAGAIVRDASKGCQHYVLTPIYTYLQPLVRKV